MFGSLPITLLSALAWTALVNAAPADPTITPPAILPRQADAGFIGWLEYNGTWYSQKCDNGLTWYQNGKYAQCCPDSVASCNAPTACVAGSQIYPLASTTITTACTGNYNNTAYSICNTAFIFESFGDSNPKTDIICGDSSVNWSYYRKIPATATEKSSALPSSVSVGSAETGAASPTQSSAPSGGGGGSKAWIAGAVIGPIVGIALIAGIIFFLMRRKKNKSTLPATGGASMGGPPPGVQQPYTDAKPQLSPDPQQGQTSPAFNQQDTYNHQGFYGQQPTSPAPQYAQPYGQPNSPPPQNAYTNDVKYGYSQAPTHPEAAELGGGSNPAPAGQSHTAELPSEAAQR